MGIDHVVACQECKEFIELHKWDVSSANSKKFPRPYEGVPIGTGEIEAAIESVIPEYEGIDPSHWILKMAPSLRSFMSKHSGHSFRIYDDSGEFPWALTEPGFEEWKEYPGPQTVKLYLPRNLVEDLNIQNESEVTAYLNTLKVYQIEDEEIALCVKKFQQLVRHV